MDADLYKKRAREAWAWTRSLLRNRYFLTGFAALVIVGLAVYLVMDRLVMPSVTRHGVAVTVPDVTAMAPESADSLLASVGLEMQQQILRQLNLPRDRVIDQRPPGGSLVKPGRSIYVTVNTGDTTTVSVPLVVGRSRLDVRGLLDDFGLRAGAIREDSVRSIHPADVISRQAPRAGTRVPRGSLIQMWYSTGPSAEFVMVPDVSGLPVEEAQARLSELGLRSVILGDGDGVVRDQGPTPGTTVREGSEVRLRTDSPGSQAG